MSVLSTVLARKPARSVDEVVGLMMVIEEALPVSDGVRSFNHLYLRVTSAVRTAIGSAALFRDPEFLNRLDVVFGNLYFDAIAAGDADPDLAPPAWRPLLHARGDSRIRPLQHALAGMNAHINRDLPAGIVMAYEELGGAPAGRDARHDDFAQVNSILETVEAQVKAEFLTGVVASLDALAAPVDDQVAMWKVRAARDAAWTNAQVLWALKPTPVLGQDYFDRLDRFTGFASRGLLTPVVTSRTRSRA